MTTPKKITARLAAIQKATGWSQRRLGDELGITSQAISAYRYRDVQPRRVVVMQIERIEDMLARRRRARGGVGARG